MTIEYGTEKVEITSGKYKGQSGSVFYVNKNTNKVSVVLKDKVVLIPLTSVVEKGEPK